jgi:hypothetical protein
MNLDLPQFAKRLNIGDGSDSEMLPGIVVDDTSAVFSGEWAKTSLAPCVGGGSRYAGPKAGGSARFEFKVPASGHYEVRLIWAGHENRASNASCTLERPGQAPVAARLNQKLTAPKGVHVLGKYEFKQGESSAVVLKTEGADGNVVADAVQVVAVP